MERHWDAVQDWLGALLAERGVDRISAEELTVPPGMDELFSLLWIKRHHEEGEFDCVIVDCAPTGETLRLLSFPDVVTWWLEKILPSQRRLAPLARTLFDMPLPGDGGVRRRRAPGAQPRGDERHPARPRAHLDPARDEPRPDGRQGGDADLHLPEPLRLPDRRRGGQPGAAGRRATSRSGARPSTSSWSSCAPRSSRCRSSPRRTSSARWSATEMLDRLAARRLRRARPRRACSTTSCQELVTDNGRATLRRGRAVRRAGRPRA